MQKNQQYYYIDIWCGTPATMCAFHMNQIAWSTYPCVLTIVTAYQGSIKKICSQMTFLVFLFTIIFQIDSYNKSTSHLFEATLSTVVCSVAVIAQLFRLSTHPKATELRVTALASLDRHLRRLARADVALLPAGVQHGGGKGARCTAAWLLP